MKPFIPTDQCLLYKCDSKKRLAACLLIEQKKLEAIPSWATYKRRKDEKQSGGERTIYAPCKELKTVQHRIKKLLERLERPDWVYSGKKGVCHVDNAFSHSGSHYYILTDIEGFYEHCSRDAVYRYFTDTMKTAPDVASLLADLTTCEGETGTKITPAGSPCSHLLAYFAYEAMFEELADCARKQGCLISLYVDDITLSSNHAIPNPKSLVNQLDRIAKSYHHTLKRSKTRYYGKGKYKVVTGVALDGGGNAFVPNKLGMKVKNGFKKVLAGDTSMIKQTQGRISAAKQIAPAAFPEISRQLSQNHR